MRRPGRTAGRRPTSSSRSASLLLFHRRAGSPEPPRRRRARAEPRARRSLIAPPISSTNADRVVVRRVRRPGPHRRAPTDVILTFSFVAALPIAAPAHSSRHDDSERAEPRARRSLIAPLSTSSTCADRVVVRRVRRPGRTAGRRPTSSSRSASLLLFHRRAGSPEPPRRRRARAEPRARRSLIAPPISSTNADRVVVRRVRRPGRTAERRPTSSSRSASLLLCLSPRQLTRADTTTASAPSREHVVP